MDIKILQETGYNEALLGISLSYNAPLANMPDRTKKLAHMHGGHNGFLEMMIVWLDITAPRCFWQQADRYRLSARQSESTMHTLTKTPLTQDNFLKPIPEEWLILLNKLITEKNLENLKFLLPEGFLQRRIWCLSYKTLQNIYNQRHKHKLTEWNIFCNYILENLKHPEFIKIFN